MLLTSTKSKHYLEIMPAACLLQRHRWRQAAQSLPRGGCLLVTNPRLPDQAALFQTLKRCFQARGRTVLLWSLEPNYNQITIS